MNGLTWLAKVGPSPLDAWRSAMGWSEVAARSHARRLQDRGWLARYPMIRGDGCLFTATRTGVTMTGAEARVVSAPRMGTWPQHIAVAWTAAWVTLRGRDFLGPRELLLDPRWSTNLQWRDYHGGHRAVHRPSLVVRGEEDQIIAIEVTLTRRPATRVQAELLRHMSWQVHGRTHGVVYICGDDISLGRIKSSVAELGLANSGFAISTMTSEGMRDVTIAELDRRRAEQRPSRVTSQ